MNYPTSKLDGITYRAATPKDAASLLKIYAPYVLDTAITFEYEIPSEAEFADRISHTLERYPYFVAIKNDTIIGYAYASAFHPRAAYSWCAELSIYLDMKVRGNGLGREMYEIMEEFLKKQNILNLYACIAYTENEDEYLTNASMHFHEKMGYVLNGTFHNCGYKFDRWYDMIWMEKIIGNHNPDTKKIISFLEI